MELDRLESLGEDLIHHLTNDVAVMGAQPAAVLDTLICGQTDPDKIIRLIRSMSEACVGSAGVLWLAAKPRFSRRRSSMTTC